LDAYRRPTPLAADWWTRPIERNAPGRLPLVWGDLNDIFALRGKDAGKVWIVGEGGLVLYSADYGRHWRRQYLVRPEGPAQRPAAAAWLRGLGRSDPLAALTLLAMVPNPGPMRGRPAPQDSATAPPRPPPQAHTAPSPPPQLPLADLARSMLWSVQFVDESYGWVAGGNGALFATRDGGETWEQQDSGAGAATLLALEMTDRSHGLLEGNDGVERVTDDGRNWKVSPFPTPTEPLFLHEKKVYRNLPPSSPGRAQFLKIISDAAFQGIIGTSVDCDLLGNRFWAIGAPGLARTSDGGKTWVRSPIAGSAKLRALA